MALSTWYIRCRTGSWTVFVMDPFTALMRTLYFAAGMMDVTEDTQGAEGGDRAVEDQLTIIRSFLPMPTRSVLLGLALVLGFQSPAQLSPFTGRAPVPPDSTGAYRLLFGGHFHGASTNRSGFPASTLLAGIDTINALHANALFSTGDLFLDADADADRYRSSLFSKLEVALYNAPGNHDVEGHSYIPAFGPTYGVLDLGADRVLWLDTERDNGNIIKDQLEHLRTSLADFGGSNLFIVSHRPLWAEGDSPYSPLFPDNTRSILRTNFENDVYPLLEQVAQRAKVYWISGSMAGRAPASIFFQEHAPNITYIQSAIRDVPRDALLVADVRDGAVHWHGVSLTGESLKPVAEYDADFWQRSLPKGEPFNPRLIPMYVKQTLTTTDFWYGLISGVVVLLLMRLLLRRWL